MTGNISLGDVVDGGIAVAVIGLLLKAVVDLVRELRQNKQTNGSTHGDIQDLRKELIEKLIELKGDLKAEIIRVRDSYHELSNQFHGLVQKSAVNDWRLTQLEDFRKEVERDKSKGGE